MFCCAQCFGDSFLDQHIPKISKHSGVCDYCNATSTALIKPEALLDYFQSVCSIYSEDDSSDAKTLVTWFQDDWQIFCTLDPVKAQALLGEILNDGEIVRKKYRPLGVQGLSAVQKWSTFRDEIMWKNRFFFRHELDLERMKSLFDNYLATDASEFSERLYRARIQVDDVGYDFSKMACPPPKSTKNGRANPVGIPYLYAASTPETAIAETRPHPGDQLTVAQFRITQSLRLLNLLHPRKTISPFALVDEEDLPALRYDLAFLCHLESELAKPILPRVADLEYLPTQYLCEFIKNCGYDGVVFKSSISNGANIALFNDSKVQVEALSYYEVTRLHYEQQLK